MSVSGHWHNGQASGYDWISRSTRLAIYARDGFRCIACGYRAITIEHVNVSALHWNGLTLDHLDTNKRGADPKNLVTLCLPCNSSRRDTDPKTWNPDFAEAACVQIRKPLDRKAALALAKKTWPERFKKDVERSRRNREKRARAA